MGVSLIVGHFSCGLLQLLYPLCPGLATVVQLLCSNCLSDCVASVAFTLQTVLALLRVGDNGQKVVAQCACHVLQVLKIRLAAVGLCA
jgi:hypothetical protein